MKDVKWEAESCYVNFPKAKDLSLGQLVSLLKSDPFPKQNQDQSIFQAEHFRPKSCSELKINVLTLPSSSSETNIQGKGRGQNDKTP